MRELNKRWLNPAMLYLAGRPHWYASRVEHVGRRSGRPYATPVVAVPVEGGLVIPLPYGPDVDWCRNLRAAGGGTVVRQGRRHTVSAPVVRAHRPRSSRCCPRSGAARRAPTGSRPGCG